MTTDYPFPKCAEGHDLTGKDAFIYDSGGSRRCRVCAAENAKKRKIRISGSWDGTK